MKPAALALSFLLATSVAAQQAAPVSGLTIHQLIDAARVGDSISDLATSRAAMHVILQRQLSRLQRPALQGIPLAAIAQASMASGPSAFAPFARVARVSTKTTAIGLAGDEGVAIDTLAIAMGQSLRSPLTEKLGAANADRLLAPLDSFNYARRAYSLDLSLEKLRRFERKFGPAAPKLNVVEVLLNFGAQWIPAFRPDKDGWPSPLEFMASYVPDYITMNHGKATGMTAAEIGLRYYIFANGWGDADGGGVLKPGHVALGVAIAAANDGALQSVWRGKPRVGGYFAWGAAKIAYVGGENSRFMITRQVQLVPWVF